MGNILPWQASIVRVIHTYPMIPYIYKYSIRQKEEEMLDLANLHVTINANE